MGERPARPGPARRQGHVGRPPAWRALGGGPRWAGPAAALGGGVWAPRGRAGGGEARAEGEAGGRRGVSAGGGRLGGGVGRTAQAGPPGGGGGGEQRLGQTRRELYRILADDAADADDPDQHDQDA